MKSNPLQGVIIGVLAGSIVWLSGCAIYDAAIVGLHDSLDEMKAAKTNQSTPVVSTNGRSPDSQSGVASSHAPAGAPATTIPPDPSVKYNGGNEKDDGGFEYEIWQHNWHGMNIRVHANPGEGRIAGIPIAGKWYPINMSIMPKDIVTMTRTATGATFTAKDFTAPSGQKYRIAAMKADGLGTVDKVRRLDLPESKFGGAVLIWYATIE